PLKLAQCVDVTAKLGYASGTPTTTVPQSHAEMVSARPVMVRAVRSRRIPGTDGRRRAGALRCPSATCCDVPPRTEKPGAYHRVAIDRKLSGLVESVAEKHGA